MQKKNKNDKAVELTQKDNLEDPFLRRIQLQGAVLKKLLAEVDLQSKTETEVIAGDEKS